MKPKHVWMMAVVTGVATLAVLYWQTPVREVPLPAGVPDAPQPPAPAIPETVVPPTAVVPMAADEQGARLAFHARTRAFFAQAPALSVAERTARAKEIEAGVEEYERRGELSASEALLLRIALIHEAVADPSQQAQQIAAVEDRYRVETQRRQAAHAAQRDPMFELYKLRESAIVTNVMAMREIPGGLSRDEYLRQQLQSERELLEGG